VNVFLFEEIMVLTSEDLLSTFFAVRFIQHDYRSCGEWYELVKLQTVVLFLLRSE
jgi:hypothetical protein